MAKIPGYYTLQEAADVLGVTKPQVSRYIKKGRLCPIDLGQQKVLEQAAVHTLERKKPGNPNFGKKKSRP